RQLRNQLTVLEDVLDLRSEIKGEIGKLLAHRLRDSERMSRTVQEIGIAKSYVLGSRSYETANVFENDLRGNNKKSPVVHRRDRAMCALMQAAAAGFDITDEPLLAFDLEPRVVFERHKRTAIRRREVQSLEHRPRHASFCAYALNVNRRARFNRFDEPNEGGFKLAADH